MSIADRPREQAVALAGLIAHEEVRDPGARLGQLAARVEEGELQRRSEHLGKPPRKRADAADDGRRREPLAGPERHGVAAVLVSADAVGIAPAGDRRGRGRGGAAAGLLADRRVRAHRPGGQRAQRDRKLVRVGGVPVHAATAVGDAPRLPPRALCNLKADRLDADGGAGRGQLARDRARVRRSAVVAPVGDQRDRAGRLRRKVRRRGAQGSADRRRADGAVGSDLGLQRHAIKRPHRGDELGVAASGRPARAGHAMAVQTQPDTRAVRQPVDDG